MIVDTEARALTARSKRAGISNPWRLLLVSSAALYLEIVLIRWIGTEVRIFAFFQNLSLIACFLGFGVGCFNTKQRGSLLPSLAAITGLVVLINLPFQVWRNVLTMMSSALSLAPDAALWGDYVKLTQSEYWTLTVFSALMLA